MAVVAVLLFIFILLWKFIIDTRAQLLDIHLIEFCPPSPSQFETIINIFIFNLKNGRKTLNELDASAATMVQS